MNKPTIEEVLEQQKRWEEHLDHCSLCETLRDGFCLDGSVLLFDLVTALKGRELS